VEKGVLILDIDHLVPDQKQISFLQPWLVLKRVCRFELIDIGVKVDQDEKDRLVRLVFFCE